MEPGNIPAAVYTAWWTGLVLTILLLPVAVCLLHRVFSAARSIQRYLAEMEAAGARIADNTEAIATLEATGAAAGGLLSSVNGIEAHSRALSENLARRSRGQAGDGR